MCDTVLAPPETTAGKVMLFGKNSDRQRNEAQVIERRDRAEFAQNSEVMCTYIAIPQVRQTYAMILCRPFWIWGAEMGANEHGVVIGNEGIHARIPAPEEKALTGMDLLRLALERSVTAAEAVTVITGLLDRYGQGGNCGHLVPNYYNNGFLVADSTEAFVIETVGREWLTERVSGVRSLSNTYSIGRSVEHQSGGLPGLIRQFGWSSDQPPDYADVIGNPHREHIGQACARRARSTSLLRLKEGQLGVENLIGILRDHGSSDGFTPEREGEITLCMHAGADNRPGQTVGAMVSEIHRADAAHWVTGTSAPCISIFKPTFVDVPIPAHGPMPTGRYDPTSLWWKHEHLHRRVLMNDFGRFLEEIRSERDCLEAEFRSRVRAVLNGGNSGDRAKVAADCWTEAAEVEAGWADRMSTRTNSPYLAVWADMNREAGIDPSN